MKPPAILLAVALLNMLGVTPAMADCQIADAKLEEAILQKPELRGVLIARRFVTCATYATRRSRSGPTGVTMIASASWATSANSSPDLR
jgi:hypothetical protein